MRNDGALTTQQAFITPKYRNRELLVSDIRFTKEVCATLGTNYDVLKGKSNSFKIYLFELQKRFIFNYEYIPLIGHFGDKKLRDYFLPSQSRKNSSLAGKTIDN